MLGVLPNAAAAVAIPFVLTGMWAEVARTDDPVSCRRAFYALLVCSTAALVIWEFVQQGSGSLVFDRHDIGATIAGSVAALGLFRVAFAAASADHANAPSPNERKGSQ